MKRTLTLSALTLVVYAQAVLAVDKAPALSAEQRQKMAAAHESMAVCLKSDRPLKECHDEMMKACHDNMGKDGCPMMQMGKHMGHGHGKGHGHDHDAMKDEGTGTEAKK